MKTPDDMNKIFMAKGSPHLINDAFGELRAMYPLNVLSTPAVQNTLVVCPAVHGIPVHHGEAAKIY